MNSLKIRYPVQIKGWYGIQYIAEKKEQEDKKCLSFQRKTINDLKYEAWQW